jgi:hypothetical protein
MIKRYAGLTDDPKRRKRKKLKSRTRVETDTINDGNIAYGDAVVRVPPLRSG